MAAGNYSCRPLTDDGIVFSVFRRQTPVQLPPTLVIYPVSGFALLKLDQLFIAVQRLRPKLHYTDTGYGRVVQQHQRTPPTNELTTSLQQICHIAMPKTNISTIDMSRCWDVANFCQLVVSVSGKMLYNKFSRLRTYCTQQ